MAECKRAAATFLSLPSDLLCQIGRHLTLQERQVLIRAHAVEFCVVSTSCTPWELVMCWCRLVLSRVCKQLHAFATDPNSPLWHDINLRHPHVVYDLEQSLQQVAFVQRHINALRTVELGAYMVGFRVCLPCLVVTDGLQPGQCVTRRSHQRRAMSAVLPDVSG
jgi:F-box-like